MNKVEAQSLLRQAKARIQIHRGKTMNSVYKKIKDVQADIDSGNEGMALIHVNIYIVFISIGRNINKR